jgi:hypothetical protein
VIAGLVLLKLPAASLLRVMVMTTAGPAGTGAGESALYPGHGVVIVAAGCVASAGWPVAFSVANFDQVPECWAGVVGGGLVPVVAVVDRNGLKIDRQLRPACPVRFAEAGPRQP